MVNIYVLDSIHTARRDSFVATRVGSGGVNGAYDACQ